MKVSQQVESLFGSGESDVHSPAAGEKPVQQQNTGDEMNAFMGRISEDQLLAHLTFNLYVLLRRASTCCVSHIVSLTAVRTPHTVSSPNRSCLALGSHARDDDDILLPALVQQKSVQYKYSLKRLAPSSVTVSDHWMVLAI